MARLLGLLLLLGLGWLIVRQLLGATRAGQDRTRNENTPPRFEKTVRCARCGVHMPLALAHETDDGHVCGEPDCSARADRATRDRR
ncbi:hypothetical protein J7355_10330 [Endozoicomonas sp. G2_2]|uniref:hypothetical protein n=1 Tax=Gammaproteobacteria TaxID=1236 RepID=UPI000C3E046C|nr:MULTISPECIES: hypothetical protein [Gammaproteobacteria]MAS11060.1 hypothetical protein [Salinisphaera sp.]MBO9470496.1 hypothetical protein [Endozoicomonas sp. G2_2]|tara:strand:- start:53 stop:310 length:258 start_codon:yes stop_codon:yes gene_type:complete